MNKETEKSFNETLRMAEAVGAIKVINTIQTKFRTSLGEIYISPVEWTKFMTPYTELPK